MGLKNFYYLSAKYMKYFRIALAKSPYYLVQLKNDTYIHGKIFAILLKIMKSEKRECLAQRTFPSLL